MSTATKQKSTATSIEARVQLKVKSEIQSMLRVNGSTPTAYGWVPRRLEG